MSGLDLLNVLPVLGLDSEGPVITKARKTNFVKGIRFLCDFHFGNYNEHDQADIMGEIMFNLHVFQNKHQRKCSRSPLGP